VTPKRPRRLDNRTILFHCLQRDMMDLRTSLMRRFHLLASGFLVFNVSQKL
jgi:hypothetical protein